MTRLYDKRFDCYFKLENELIDREDLKPEEMMVYVVLCRYANNNDGAFPSYETIAKKAGISRRHAIRMVEKLVEKKLLEKEKRKKKNKNESDTNVYYILSAKLASDSQSPAGDSQSPRVVTDSHPKKNYIKKNNIENTSLSNRNNFKQRDPEIYDDPNLYSNINNLSKN